MHILLLHQLFLSAGDAGMTQHHAFARHLVAAGHRVTVLAGTRSYLTGGATAARRRGQLAPGLELIPCGAWGSVHRSFVQRTIGFLSFMMTAFAAGLRLRDVDLVWSTSPPLPQVCTAWALAALRRAPLVFEVRDLWPAVAVELGVLRSRPLIALAAAAERFLYRRARRVLVNSPGFLPQLRARGVPDHKVALVPNGVEVSAFDPQATGEAFRREHGLGDGFLAVYAGAHGLSNDLGVLLEAADRLRDEPGLTIVLVGDGKEKPALQARARALGLSNLRFLPPLPHPRMPELLAAADCGLAILRPIPLFATTYPNKVFDCMAAGRPVVLAIDGVIRELVEQAGAGVAVPPGDPEALAQALRTLARDRAAARAMGGRGRRLVEQRFDRAAMALRLEHELRRAAEPS